VIKLLDVNVTRYSVEKAKRFSDETKENLENNLRFLETMVEPELKNWNDIHVQRYLLVSAEITQAIREISQNLEKISEYCVKEIQWIDIYDTT